MSPPLRKNGSVSATILLLIICCLLTDLAAFSQSLDPESVLPRHKRRASITAPSEFFGFPVGSRHLRHDQIVSYMKQLASQSERVTFVPYATSHGGRQLFVLVITSPDNQKRISQIKEAHREIASGKVAAPRQGDRSVMYLGYGVHGDEASAMNASPLLAYHLASSQSDTVVKALSQSVFLVDPSLNPDGGSRFAHWANENRGQLASHDPADREHQQDWPGGRTNYYWFDLNRDWLPVTHPESRGRIQLFHEWKPNVVLDFHEMGSSSSYFFQPGIPSRTNPLTPARNVELTELFAGNHAEKLDAAGELFFTEERFDDFYIGKGSTYPDVNGAVGILFEQGSSRGLLIETERTKRTFSESVANQVRTSLSSIEALAKYSDTLLQFQCEFFAAALDSGRKGKSFLLHGEASRIAVAKDLLALHDITTEQSAGLSETEHSNQASDEYLLIPSEQSQYTLIKSMMSKEKTFQENVFYDVSTWHLPSVLDLEAEEIDTEVALERLSSLRKDRVGGSAKRRRLGSQEIGYAVAPNSLNFAALISALQSERATLRVVTQPVTVSSAGAELQCPRGTLLILRQLNLEVWAAIQKCLQQFDSARQASVIPLASSRTLAGPDLGSDTNLQLVHAKPALVVGAGTNAYTAGSLWHHLDVRVQQPTTLVNTTKLSQTELSDYSVLILPDGGYDLWGEAQAKHLTDYLQGGGVVIAVCDSYSWLTKHQVVAVDPTEETEREEGGDDEKVQGQFPDQRYGDARNDVALKAIAGAIFEVKVDGTHPLAYGFRDEVVPVFRRGTYHYPRSENTYQTAGVYDQVIAGYVSEENEERLAGTAAVFVVPVGKGRVIVLADNPVFRGYTRGAEPFLTNSIYLGPSIRLPKSSGDEHEH